MTRSATLIRVGIILTAVIGASVAILTSGTAYRDGSGPRDKEAACGA
jgi:hypothetical protein